MSEKLGYDYHDGDTSGIRPGGEDTQAANVPVGLNQPLVRGHPEVATGHDNVHCGSCGKYLKKSRKHPLTREKWDFFENEASCSKRASLDTFDFICHACQCRYERKCAKIIYEENRPIAIESQALTQIKLDIGRASYSQNTCVFGCSKGRYRISDSTRAQVAKYFRFYIPEGARVCEEHNKNSWTEVPSTISHVFTADQVTDIINLLRNTTISDEHSKINFDYFEDLEDNIIEHWTGLNKENFLRLLNNVPSLRQSKKRHAECALAIYLAKLKTGNTDQELPDVFMNGKRSTAERLINNARKAIALEFTPQHLGFSHCSRDDILERRTSTACRLFSLQTTSSLITIWDGTYVYTQKSSNNAFQRSTYSMHKQRHLVKPMMCVAPDGYIIDVMGPYRAIQNDASIMEDIMKKMSEVRSMFRSSDIFVVDRGFRDVKAYLESQKFVVKMPDIIPAGETQLGDVLANRKRLVTKVRFVVEVINGHLKTCFRYFDRVWCIQSLPHLITDFRNAAALHNVSHTVIISDAEYTDDITQLMIGRSHKQNLLYRLVLEQQLNRKYTEFILLDAEQLGGFPVLTKNNLYKISLGSYQIKQAKSYYAEHMAADGRYSIQLSRNIEVKNLSDYGIFITDPILLKVRIQSRHVNRTRYYVYILAKRDGEGAEAIPEDYCSCKNGCRTVGCCAHVMTVIWCTGYARYLEEDIRVLEKTTSNIFVALESPDAEEQ